MVKAGGYGVQQWRRGDEEEGEGDGSDGRGQALIGDGRMIGRKVKAWQRCGMLTL
jgi:hypothetical protein